MSELLFTLGRFINRMSEKLVRAIMNTGWTLKGDK